MKDKRHILEQVDKTLDSLDGIQSASANPFLFTRILAVLQKEETNFWSQAFAFINRPMVAFAGVAIAIIINAVVLFESRSEPVKNMQDEEQVFASEYNLSTNTIYDATVDQP
jgi:hypothetical protein